MLKRIKSFFDEHLMLESDAGKEDPDHALRLGVAALLLEMTHMDGEVRPEQRAAVEKAVRTCFDLTEPETNELLDLAEAERANSTDYFQFTSLINGAYTPKQKERLVETLWRVAYSNEVLHHYEEYLVRKVADLLHVPHRAFIGAKHRAGGGI
jgi:uncharacterized tellurite resistance protein B-like protein